MNVPNSPQNRSPKQPAAVHWKAIPEHSQTGRSLELLHSKDGASQVSLMVKNLPASAGDMKEVGLIPELGRLLEESTATHPSILARRISWTGQPGGLQSKGSQRVQTQLCRHIHIAGIVEAIQAWVGKAFPDTGHCRKDKEQRSCGH